MLCSLGRLFAAIIPRTETAIDIDDKITVYCPVSGSEPQTQSDLIIIFAALRPHSRNRVFVP